jgi:hypothetical protein
MRTTAASRYKLVFGNFGGISAKRTPLLGEICWRIRVFRLSGPQETTTDLSCQVIPDKFENQVWKEFEILTSEIQFFALFDFCTA